MKERRGRDARVVVVECRGTVEKVCETYAW